MIQQQTIIKVSDNSGAKKVRCIKVLGGFKKKHASLGDTLKVSVQKLRNKIKDFRINKNHFSTLEYGNYVQGNNGSSTTPLLKELNYEIGFYNPHIYYNPHIPIVIPGFKDIFKSELIYHPYIMRLDKPSIADVINNSYIRDLNVFINPEFVKYKYLPYTNPCPYLCIYSVDKNLPKIFTKINHFTADLDYLKLEKNIAGHYSLVDKDKEKAKAPSEELIAVQVNIFSHTSFLEDLKEEYIRNYQLYTFSFLESLKPFKFMNLHSLKNTFLYSLEDVEEAGGVLNLSDDIIIRVIMGDAVHVLVRMGEGTSREIEKIKDYKDLNFKFGSKPPSYYRQRECNDYEILHYTKRAFRNSESSLYFEVKHIIHFNTNNNQISSLLDVENYTIKFS